MITPSTDDTIVAIASAPGPAPRGVLRVSGPDALGCLERCFETQGEQPSPPASGAHVVDGVLRLPPPLPPIACHACIWPDSRSYTRQPAVEIHMLGAPVLLEAALESLCEAGARPAAPGEFTLRAFLAGRLDLTQAEAVLGVIDAHDRRELNTALEQLSGGLAGPLAQLRNHLLDLLAHLEAGLDFVEEDIQFISSQELQDQLSEAAERIRDLLRQMTEREEMAGDARVVLRGWPNVGKSSLLNALARQDAALVSPMAGTTRDFVTCRIDLQGRGCLLIDTAGVERDATEAVATEAQAIADRQREAAHVELFCLDSTRAANEWEQAELARVTDRPRIIVWTKADARPGPGSGREGIRTSSRTGAGLDRLRGEISCRLFESEEAEHHCVPATAVRCRESLRAAQAALQRARRLTDSGMGEELIAAELRHSLDHLGQVLGVVHTDDILDRIFSRFCIGK